MAGEVVIGNIACASGTSARGMVPVAAGAGRGEFGFPVVIVNGIVFGYGSGEETKQAFPDIGLQFDSSIRAAKGTHATIYALDARTGDVLWSSGDQMHQWNHFSGLTVANGHVYLGTYDGTLYSFGVRATDSR